MPTQLRALTLNEVSLVDRPANSETDPVTGAKIPRARIALCKRDASVDKAEGKTEDGKTFPKGDYAYTPSDNASEWKLRLTSTPGGDPDPHIVGAAVAALGKGFRGNKVQIPAEALAGVKAKVRAAWRKANKDKDTAEMPDVLKGETMTLEELEARVTKAEEMATKTEAELVAVKADNTFLKSENDTVIKMSKLERKAYAAMDAGQRKAYMAADEAKRKEMMDAMCRGMAEKVLVDQFTETEKSEFEAGGPEVRKAVLAAAGERISKKKAPPFVGDDEEEEGEEEMKGKADKVDKNDDVDKTDDTKVDVNKVYVMQISGLTDRVAKAEERVAKAEAELAAARKAERLVGFTKRAEEELRFTKGAPEEKGAMLMKMADALGEDSDAYKLYFETLKSADTALAGHFSEVGKAHSGPLPAEKILDAKAAEIAKRDNIDIGNAMLKACQENMDLYNEVNMQHRRLTVPA